MKKIFKKYLNSVLSPSEFDSFTQFIKHPRNNQVISDLMKSEWNTYQNHLDTEKRNPAVFAKIKQRIWIEERQKMARTLKLYSIGFRAAAILIVSIIITSIWLFQKSQSSTQTEMMQIVEIPYGARTQMQMPDGSKVWLNSGSTIKFSNDFSKNREVELEGEAFFEVVKSKVPFNVHTDYGEVKVLGTAFNVDAYPNEGFSATLERGVIEFSASFDKKQVLEPGEQVKIVEDKIVKECVDTEVFTSWKKGRLVFKREPFPAMIKRLERWYNVTIEFSDNDFEGLWFSGIIEGESINEVMEMICKSAPVNYDYDSQTRIIHID